MLLNVSNHPSVNWDDAQLKEAAIYGTVVDMDFPNVSPYDDEDYILSLATVYADKICSYNVEKLVVHIMGEMNFTFALVKLLQKRGIDCVASTSERVVTEMGDQKISTFKFVRFRRYE